MRLHVCPPDDHTLYHGLVIFVNMSLTLLLAIAILLIYPTSPRHTNCRIAAIATATETECTVLAFSVHTADLLSNCISVKAAYCVLLAYHINPILSILIPEAVFKAVPVAHCSQYVATFHVHPAGSLPVLRAPFDLTSPRPYSRAYFHAYPL